jgi:tungstate transport system substrate-binding protein
MSFHKTLTLVALMAALALGSVRTADGQHTSIMLASTSSVENSGLLAAILPEFTAATGIAVRVLAQGSGQALDTARRGDADLVLVHDPEAEERFIGEGHGVRRRQIAWNDFIIVGPAADPAGIRGGRDAVAAFAAIAEARVAFVSRGDRSGTNELELRLWQETGINLTNGVGSWYRDIGGGMGRALNIAAAMPAYTLTDRGTWISFRNKRTLVAAVEGDPRLINRYSVIELNPATRPSAKLAAARRLAEWLASAAGQAAIGAYAIDGERPFHPSAAAPR